MGKDTSIGWADSTLNLQMGCDGCELWTKKRTGAKANRTCYAGLLTERYGGKNGWPVAFAQPKMFPDRLSQALRWPDLSGIKRPDKPWLDDLPRIIFLNDMGDTFTESLPIDWMMPLIPDMETSVHEFLFLTKRVSRMKLFFEQLGYVPQNFWLGASVTSHSNIGRIDILRNIEGAKIKFLSVEPLLEDIMPVSFEGIDWVIVGGCSGFSQASMTNLEWVYDVVKQADKDGAKVFVKQLGSRPYLPPGPSLLHSTMPHSINLRQVSDTMLEYPTGDGKGEIMNRYPAPLRRREMPEVKTRWRLF